MSVYQNKKTGLWYFSVRYKLPDGTEKQKIGQSKKWTKRKPAEEAEREFLLSIDAMSGDKITYKELLESYLEYKKSKIKLRSYLDIKRIQNKHIIPFFGKKIVSEITKSDFADW